MSESAFEEFRSLVLSDESLQEELREIIDRKTFISHAVELGARNGYEFTSTDVEHAINAARREWIEHLI